jgi:hypothetical protein
MLFVATLMQQQTAIGANPILTFGSDSAEA